MVPAPLFSGKLRIHPTKGITLLELAVVMAVLTILTGGIMISLRQTGTRALNNASLQLQADMRYVQRRAVAEGRQFGIVFEIVNNRYRIIHQINPTAPNPVFHTLRTVQVSGGARLVATSADRLVFHPRGTPSAGFSALLGYGSNTQRITATVSGGRILVFDINQPHYE